MPATMTPVDRSVCELVIYFVGNAIHYHVILETNKIQQVYASKQVTFEPA